MSADDKPTLVVGSLSSATVSKGWEILHELDRNFTMVRLIETSPGKEFTTRQADTF